MIRGALALKTLVLVAAVAITPAPSIAQELSVTGASAASAHGLVGGVQGGYNWQRGPAVFGFEADFSAADLSTSMTGSLSCLGLPCRVFVPPPAAATSSSIDWYGTVRGRLGWAAGPVLLYGTGGL